MKPRALLWMVVLGASVGLMGCTAPTRTGTQGVSTQDTRGVPAVPSLSPDARKALAEARRLVVVTSSQWDSPMGRLVLFNRGADGALQPASAAYDVTLGSAGLGWGRGLTQPPEDGAAPLKREGDGRSPAGIFRLGQVRGYAEVPGLPLALPYRPSTSNSYCVDDVASPLYNKLVDLPDSGAPKTWTSAEDMRRPDELYQWVVTVDHNALEEPQRAVAAGGSCIFLHVWRGPGRPTAGCTAMELGNLESLLPQLDGSTLLVQLPLEVYNAAAAAWSLPSLDAVTGAR